METIAFNAPKTKPCPFCAETIQARAVKCRFCNEFLNTNKAKALLAGADSADESEDKKTDDSILFVGKPSIWAIAAAIFRGLIVLVLAYFIITYPLEDLSIFHKSDTADSETASQPSDVTTSPDSVIAEKAADTWSRVGFNERQLVMFRRYRIIAGSCLAALVILVLTTRIAQLKTTRYEVSTDRIEWSRGLLDRKVDNIDMFRITDLKLRKSMSDCLVGVGTVTVITTDKSDPEFAFEKVRNPRKLYDAIKKASLDADRRSNAVHLE